MKKIFLMLFLGSSIFISCGDDDDDGTGGNNSGDCADFSLAAEIQDELNAFTSAGQVYFSDPNIENCEAYKTAINAYLDALRQYEDCVSQVGDVDSWQDSIDSAQSTFDLLIC